MLASAHSVPAFFRPGACGPLRRIAVSQGTPRRAALGPAHRLPWVLTGFKHKKQFRLPDELLFEYFPCPRIDRTIIPIRATREMGSVTDCRFSTREQRSLSVPRVMGNHHIHCFATRNCCVRKVEPELGFVRTYQCVSAEDSIFYSKKIGYIDCAILVNA